MTIEAQEIWFDTEQGGLFAGSETEIKQYTDIATVQRLGELLTAKEFPYRNGDFEQLIKTEDWKREECQIYGTWLLGVLAPHTANLRHDKRFTRNHIERMRQLGLGPSINRIVTIFDSLEGFREELGIYGGRSRGKFDAWSLEDFANYAAKLATRLKRCPNERDYSDFNKTEGGPTLRMIARRTGGLRPIHELIGYPDMTGWDDEDIVNWGVEAMEANGNLSFTRRLVDILSRRHAGPSVDRIYDHFHSFPTYRQQVAKRLQEKNEAQQSHFQSQLEWAKTALDDESLALLQTLPHAGQLAFIGRHQVARRYLTNKPPEAYRYISKQPAGTFMAELLSRRPDIRAGDIEVTAVTLGVFNDIWPPNRYLQRLHVTNNEMRSFIRASRRHVKTANETKAA